MRPTGPLGANRRAPVVFAAVTAALLAVGTAGCGPADPASGTRAGVSAPASTPAGVIGIRDPWVKAADKGMTAAFGTLVNDSDTDVTLTGATTAVSALELHEMTMQDGKMVMRQKQGGIVIRAKGTHVLEPGGDHLMLMDLRRPVRAGDEVTVTLTFADGRTQQFTAVAKPFTGAQESYAPGHGAPATQLSGQPEMSGQPTTGPTS
ncbi:copper chaperone PCu(A)C [Micromonospora sp. S-DT3-3-22]|uniref:copper chaperone PCu(A)C n=1 Tax=Micromonospora sp. S-DT3-3-22 TaxID=2755359 RepID=UPI001890A3FF|nr:copper chaperone PCu(A)C [Micromonospora sp. S-DT3-3-22]